MLLRLSNKSLTTASDDKTMKVLVPFINEYIGLVDVSVDFLFDNMELL